MARTSSLPPTLEPNGHQNVFLNCPAFTPPPSPLNGLAISEGTFLRLALLLLVPAAWLILEHTVHWRGCLIRVRYFS